MVVMEFVLVAGLAVEYSLVHHRYDPMLPCIGPVHWCTHCMSSYLYLRKMFHLKFGFVQLFLVELAELVARVEILLHDAKSCTSRSFLKFRNSWASFDRRKNFDRSLVLCADWIPNRKNFYSVKFQIFSWSGTIGSTNVVPRHAHL